MQFRTVRAKVKDGYRVYGQIVESYRRESDGMPMHKVVASLGAVTEAQAAVFKAAFGAARTGAGVQVLDAGALDGLGPELEWSRDWLDVAACLQAWEDSGLRAMMRGVMAGHAEEVHPADVVAALVVQRCVAPASKLAACEWFGDTALPELLGVAPARFHNTRLHRVLERLEKVDAELQCAMSDLLVKADGQPCTALFIDCTDTWFVGRGPEMAERGKTKEEFYREKIGILLLCRQDGMPLRFKVLRGNTEDGTAMLAQLGELKEAAWLGAVPVVADRALGNTSDLLEMSDLGVQFVTALVSSEHAAYGATFDCPALHDIDPRKPTCLDEAGAAAQAAGMVRHAPDLYVLERAVVRRDDGDRAAAAEALGKPATKGYRRGDDLARDMLTQAQRYRSAVESGKFASMQALQRGIGRSNGHMGRILGMLKLPADVQAQIDAGVARNLTKRAIERVCRASSAETQRTEFARECAEAAPKQRNDRHDPPPPNDAHSPWVQVAIAFNPVMWQVKRKHALDRHKELLAKVEHINQRLAAPTHALSLVAAETQIALMLKEAKSVQMYAVERLELIAGRPTLRLVRDEKRWRATRARDGIQVIVAAPQIDMPAADRVRLYRSKDKVEKDFHEIKGVLEVRPVWHRTDAKVRAHVALCVLALAVQRWMGLRLKKAGRPESPARAIDELRNVRLIGQRLPGSTAAIAQPNGTSQARQQLANALGVGWALRAATAGARLKSVR